MCDDTCEDILKLKQVIIDEGLYEPGMTTDDMQQIYKTLNRSKRTADNEIEYRDLMSQTDLNCSDISLLKTEVNDIDDSNNVNTVLFATTSKKSTSSNTRQRKLPKRVLKNDIDFNFSLTINNKSVLSNTQSKNIPILYHHPTVLKLPVTDRAEIILLYLQNQLKQIRTNEIKEPVLWNEPIVPHPNIKFNNDLCVDTKPEFAEETLIETNESPNKDFITLKSRRVVKRKNYQEGESDEELTTIVNKKTKSNTVNVEHEELRISPSTSNKSHSQKVDSDDDFCPTSKKIKSNDHLGAVTVNKSTPLSKSSETPPKTKKWFSKIGLPKLFTPDVSDRTNKLFDKLKEEDSKKKPNTNNVTLDDNSDLSDCDEIFPTTTSVNIHNETTPKLKGRGRGTVTKKSQTKSRKKITLKVISEDKKENNSTQIPATNFYGKNKENELDASNNNKSTTSKMIQCPICSRSFPDSEIEGHASICEQFDDSQADSLCIICNKYILNVDMDAHKFGCLEAIAEGSTVKTDKNKNKSNLGFLCDVCDKYVVDSNQFEHASNCIATSK